MKKFYEFEDVCFATVDADDHKAAKREIKECIKKMGVKAMVADVRLDPNQMWCCNVVMMISAAREFWTNYFQASGGELNLYFEELKEQIGEADYNLLFGQ